GGTGGSGGGPAQPVILAAGQPEPTSIAVNSSSVYWTNQGTAIANDGTVMRVPIPGGSPIVLVTGQSDPAGIAVDEARLYWTNYRAGTVMTLRLSDQTPTTLASAQDHPGVMAVDATNVYWATGSPGLGTGALMQAPKAGGT